MYFLEVIHIYHFFTILGIILFSFLYSYLLLFLKHVVSPILLELHITQETPLPPCFSIAHATLRTMFGLVGGKRVEEGSFVINAKLFWQFSYFSLNF